MTQIPPDRFRDPDDSAPDQALSDFLRQHRSVVPPAPNDLEDRLLAQVEALPHRHPGRFQPPLGRRAWVVPSALAASLIAGFVGYRAVQLRQPSPTEIASLETFIETNWQNTVNDSSENDWLPTSDTDTN